MKRLTLGGLKRAASSRRAKDFSFFAKKEKSLDSKEKRGPP